MVEEEGIDLEVSKVAAMDAGGSPVTPWMLLRAGQVEMVEETPWWLRQGREDVTSGVLMQKAVGEARSGFFNGITFLNSLQEKA